MARLRTRQTSLAFLAIAASWLLGGGCPLGSDTDDSTARANADSIQPVDIFLLRFWPKTVTIKAGTTVKWTNRGPDKHSVVTGDPDLGNAGQLFDSGEMKMGESFSYTFDTPGDYEYFCDHHDQIPTMRHAHVIVQP